MSTDTKVSSVGIIMDGNRRWAKSKGLPAKMGHKEGAETVRKICKAAGELGLDSLTLYAFSTENWKRDKEEIDAIMNLLRDFLTECIAKLQDENVRIIFLGDRSKLDQDIVDKMNFLEENSKTNDGIKIAIAINYGGRDEIVRTVKHLIDDGLSASEITEEVISKNLDTRDIKDPEIIIRTSGEMRVSNFLIWQSAYSEFFFVDKMWPEFTKEDLESVILEFSTRSRRFGGK